MKRNSSSDSVEFERSVKKIKNSTINMFNLCDDMIYEILIRLPHLHSAIQCTTVCKSWWSVINSYPNFVAAFLNRHLRSKVPPLTLLCGDNFICGNPMPTRIINLPKGSSLSRTRVSTLVDSFHWLHDLFRIDYSSILAMCEDLLLVRMMNPCFHEHVISTSYYVCNPLTGQIFKLPDHPRITGGVFWCGLVSEPKEQLGSCRTRYRVMLMFDSKENNNNNNKAYMTVFCSETGHWTEPRKIDNAVQVLSLVNYDVVACNGVLYWLGFRVLIVHCPFESTDEATERRSMIIDLPDDFDSLLLPNNNEKVRLGLFQGRPRLSLLFRVDSNHFCLKVWDLKNNSTDGDAAAASFALAHHVRIKALDLDNSMPVFVIAFHPSNGSQIFLLRNHDIYLYDLEENKEIFKVAKISSHYYKKLRDLRVFPFLFPVRPTII